MQDRAGLGELARQGWPGPRQPVGARAGRGLGDSESPVKQAIKGRSRPALYLCCIVAGKPAAAGAGPGARRWPGVTAPDPVDSKHGKVMSPLASPCLPVRPYPPASRAGSSPNTPGRQDQTRAHRQPYSRRDTEPYLWRDSPGRYRN